MLKRLDDELQKLVERRRCLDFSCPRPLRMVENRNKKRKTTDHTPQEQPPMVDMRSECFTWGARTSTPPHPDPPEVPGFCRYWSNLIECSAECTETETYRNTEAAENTQILSLLFWFCWSDHQIKNAVTFWSTLNTYPFIRDLTFNKWHIDNDYIVKTVRTNLYLWRASRLHYLSFPAINWI